MQSKKIFECRERQLLPIYIKGIDVIHENENIVLYQMAYLNTKGKETIKATCITKPEPNRELTVDENTEQRATAGRLE